MKLKDLQIDGFRGLHEVALNNLATINIITGDNSAGKTAILEAIVLMFGSTIGTLHELAGAFRSHISGRDDFENFWLWLLPRKGKNLTLSVKAITNNAISYSVIGQFQNNYLSLIFFTAEQNTHHATVQQNGGISGNVPGNWLKAIHVNLAKVSQKADAETYNSAVLRKGGEERILELMSTLDPRVKRIRYLKVTDTPLIYVDIGLDDFIPVSQMGQAFERVFSLYITVLNAKAHIVILDEIENGIHLSKMDDVWKGLAKLADLENIQIIATTHSKECLTSAFVAVENNDRTTCKRYNLKIVGDKVNVFESDSFLNSEAWA